MTYSTTQGAPNGAPQAALAVPHTAAPACPQCGGKMWDNRLSKRNPKAPDFKCRDRSCDGAIWPERRDTPAVEAAQRAEAREALDAYRAPTPTPASAPAPSAVAAVNAVTTEEDEARRGAVRAERKARIDRAAKAAAEVTATTVVPHLAKLITANTGDDVVVTIDAGAITAAVLSAYLKAGIV